MHLSMPCLTGVAAGAQQAAQSWTASQGKKRNSLLAKGTEPLPIRRAVSCACTQGNAQDLTDDLVQERLYCLSQEEGIKQNAADTARGVAWSHLLEGMSPWPGSGSHAKEFVWTHLFQDKVCKVPEAFLC